MSAPYTRDRGEDLLARLAALVALLRARAPTPVPVALTQRLAEQLAELADHLDPTVYPQAPARVAGVRVEPNPAVRGALVPVVTALTAADAVGFQVGAGVDRDGLLMGARRLALTNPGLPAWMVPVRGLPDRAPDRRALWAQRDTLLRALEAHPTTNLAPPAQPVRHALAILLAACLDSDLDALLAALPGSEEPRARRSLRAALSVARVADAVGLAHEDSLVVALAALALTHVPPHVDVAAQLPNVVAPEAGITEIGRANVAYRLRDPAPDPFVAVLRVGLAWERLGGEPPRLLPRDALARLRTDASLDATVVDALAQRRGDYPVGSAWVLRGGGVGVVVDHVAGLPRVATCLDRDGAPVTSTEHRLARGDATPHAAIDPAELGADPALALQG